MKLDRRALLCLTGSAVFSEVSGYAWAASYPTRAITMVVPFGAGGPSDIIGRVLGEGMRKALGQPVVIENVAGASGTIGVGKVARAAPDGYTLVLGNWATHVLNGPLFKLDYDIVKNFQPVALICSDALLIAGRKTLPASNLDQFIGWLKQHPQATQGTTGAGGISTMGGCCSRKKREPNSNLFRIEMASSQRCRI